jgi:amino acid adenylation domain-containing protein/non-ribosomal peptide synthase protein (TIGR01720 family)
VAGERCWWGLVRRTEEVLGEVGFVNEYGPTEGTVWSTVWERGMSRREEREVPIGVPVGNTRSYVLGRSGELLGEGAMGELYVGGAQVARGYVGRPEETAERFLPDPWAGDGSRMYRTGDRVRWVAGELEYLGRADEQVKVRGYRVEPGEVEVALREQSGVEEAAVVGRGERLVGYVVGSAEWSELRSALSERLPEYMVPTSWVRLEALPRTSTGKLDRKALPDVGARLASPDYEAPGNEVEELLSGIWGEVLGLERVGATDDFFELGGHSLVAVRLASRVREVFGVEFSVRAVFEERELRAQARAVAAGLRGGVVEEAAPERVSAEGAQPLSYAQQRLWFLDQLEPGSPEYNVPTRWRLEGRLDVDALKVALGELVRRHESLRTRFEEVDGEGRQVIEGDVELALAVEDLRGAGEEAVRARVREDGRTGFDLRVAPLVRAGLLRVADEEWVLLLTMHHIVTDGWSVQVLERELWGLYGAPGLRSRQASPLRYVDFAAWQRSRPVELDWWRERLSDWPQVLQLPSDRTRPPVRGWSGGSVDVRLAPDVAARLQALSRRLGASLYMTLLGAFQVLLWRYTGQSRFLLGTVVSGRTRRELEGIVGMFVNTIVVRAEVGGRERLEDVVRRVREEALEAYGHHDVPFERLVDELTAERDLSRTPLFQVLFAFETQLDARHGPEEADGLRRRRWEQGDLGVARFDLELNVREGPEGGLLGTLVFSEELFDRETAAQMAAHFERVLAAMGSEPEQLVRDVDLLSVDDRRRLLVEWNDTDGPYPDACLHELVAAQAARCPEATAVEDGRASLSYRELVARAGAQARRLVERGVGPDVRVGLLLERGVDLVVGVLGVLMAGGAYVPLDPRYPRERLDFMVQDSGAVLVLSDVTGPDGPAGEASLAPTGAGADNLAYVIYTSGSTGQPKGVGISHRSAVAMAWWGGEIVGADELDGMLASTSVCFDLSVFELFAPLCRGGRVVVAENALEMPQAGVRVVNTVPSAMAELVRQGMLPRSVRSVLLAGEPLTRELVADVHASGVPRVMNLYGPTEDTTYSTWTEVRPGEVPTIGRSAANKRAYVLGGEMELLPVGALGELYLGGAGVARGYLGRPALTADRFVPDPFGAPGSRLYRTGDLVRWRRDGELAFLGRVDQQVKVRGFRIELGEIESALREQEGVQDAVVTASGEADQRRLVAYVVGAAEWTALRAALRARLPEHMVPVAWVRLGEVPLTPNGKVDRRALPVPEGTGLEREYEAPRTDVESELAGIWADVLRVERVGVKDNFFELGGDSIKSIQVVSRARKAGLELRVRQLFQAQTVEELAREVGRGEVVEAEQGLVEGELTLTPIQRWFLAADIAERSHFNQGRAFELSAGIELEHVREALRALAGQHDVLRSRFWCDGTGWRGRIEREADVVLREVEVADEDAWRALAAAEQAGLDIERGPVWRAALARTADGGARLLLVLHHLVVDLVSWAVLDEDLERGLEQALRGEPVALGRKTTSYREWGRRLAELGPEAGYWEDVVRRGRELGRLRVDAGGENVVRSARAVEMRLDRPETAALEELARRYRMEVVEVVMTGLAMGLWTWNGRRDAVVEVEGHGREEMTGVDVSRTVGWFTSLYPLVVEGAGAAAGDLLKRVKETVRSVPDGGIGYGVLRYLHDDGERFELDADVVFNYLGVADAVGRGKPRPYVNAAPVGAGPEIGAGNRRRHLLEIVGRVVEGRLSLVLRTSEAVHRRETVEELARALREAFAALAAHGDERDAGGFTPSDFPQARVDQAELDRALQALRRSQGGS